MQLTVLALHDIEWDLQRQTPVCSCVVMSNSTCSLCSICMRPDMHACMPHCCSCAVHDALDMIQECTHFHALLALSVLTPILTPLDTVAAAQTVIPLLHTVPRGHIDSILYLLHSSLPASLCCHHRELQPPHGALHASTRIPMVFHKQVGASPLSKHGL